jgi:hypothetical protein
VRRPPIDARTPLFADISYALVRTEVGVVTCLFCTKTFSLMSNARRHFRESHLRQPESRPYKCDLCGDAAFMIRRHLNEHILKKHKLSVRAGYPE